MTSRERWVIAIGGNALADPDEPAGQGQQREHARQLAAPIAEALERGTAIVITHGNGPQVGARLIENESAPAGISRKPLDELVAETQGEIGHLLALALNCELECRNIRQRAVALLTHVLVDFAAPEFNRPDKPVGPSYSAERAREIAVEHGWVLAEQPGRGWRRVVPSPRPLGIVEEGAAVQLVNAGWCVIAGGGGGVPVARTAAGLTGIEAVVDKDYVAGLLAGAVDATKLVVLTDVPGAALSFATSKQRFIERMTTEEGRLHLERGEFAPGSMAPKVEACIDFVERSGMSAVIAGVAASAEALAGRAGTLIRPV